MTTFAPDCSLTPESTRTIASRSPWSPIHDCRAKAPPRSQGNLGQLQFRRFQQHGAVGRFRLRRRHRQRHHCHQSRWRRLWTARLDLGGADADVDKTAGGSAASVGTCQLGDYLNKPYRDHGDPPTPESELKTTCVTDNNACGCPAAHLGGSDFLSGKIPGSSAACCERVDILDIDCGKGSPNPHPGHPVLPGDGPSWSPGREHLHRWIEHGLRPCLRRCQDAEYNASAISDDSLFEWVFGVSVRVHIPRTRAAPARR